MIKHEIYSHYPERRINVTKYVAVFSMATLIFIIGIIFGQALISSKQSTIVSTQKEISLELADLELQTEFIQRSPCNATTALNNLGEKIDKLGTKIIFLENQIGKNDPTILELKKPYTLLMIRHYMLSEIINAQCGTNNTLIIFVYSNKQEYISDSEKQGYVIDYVKKKFLNTKLINVYSIAADIELEMTQTLLQFYNVNKIPSLIINEKLYSGFQDKDTLEGILESI